MIELIPHPLTIPVGIAVGLLIAAPIGPVNVLCIQRALERGVLGGVAAGLGAVLGDGLIALLASLGVGAISGAVSRYRDLIQMVGGLAIVAFGARLCMTAPRIVAPRPEARWAGLVEYLWDIPQTFFLTVTNPGAVLGLVAIFGGISSFVEVRTTVDALFMVAAIMVGSLMWWVVLSTLIGRLRRHIDSARLKLINVSAGLLLMVFGVVLIGELVLKAIRPA